MMPKDLNNARLCEKTDGAAMNGLVGIFNFSEE
jgi:hypothetical protein